MNLGHIKIIVNQYLRFIYDRVVALLHNNDTIVLSIHLDRYIIDTRNDLWRWTRLKLDFYLFDIFMYLQSKIYGDFCAMLLSNWIETCSHLQQKLIFNSKISNKITNLNWACFYHLLVLFLNMLSMMKLRNENCKIFDELPETRYSHTN